MKDFLFEMSAVDPVAIFMVQRDTNRIDAMFNGDDSGISYYYFDKLSFDRPVEN